MHQQALNVVMLAGGLRASTFRRQLGIPTLCLPMGHDATLLDAWLSRLRRLGRPCDVDIVVSWGTDVAHLEPLSRRHEAGADQALRVRIVMDPAPWRGTGGLLRDVTRHLDDDALVLVVEASCLPPVSLEPAFAALDDRVSGVVCSTTSREPAGVYVFRRSALELIPDEGFFDLKEQFVPRLYRQGRWLACAVVSEQVPRLRDRTGYLGTLRSLLNGTAPPRPLVSGEASIAPTARIVGATVVEAGVVVEAGALVHDSVLMSGVRVGADGIVSRSIVGRNASLAPGAVHRDTVVSYREETTPSARPRPDGRSNEPRSVVAARE